MNTINFMEIAIIGAGAAGFFTAINLMKLSPNANVTIYEAGSAVLSKVAVSGGGRCNLTNSFEGVKDLVSVYPRGDKFMKRAFKVFSHKDAYEWFEENGIELVTQSDNCVFPCSQDAQEIISTFIGLSKDLGVALRTGHKVVSINQKDSGYELVFSNEEQLPVQCDAVVVTTGGKPQREDFSMFDALPLDVVSPVPSLFSFNIPNDSITEMTGTIVENAIVRFQGAKPKASGTLLITHWGVSGPAILKLSSYAARHLSDCNYRAKLLINWIGESNEQNIHKELNSIISKNSQKLVTSIKPYGLPSRLWLSILNRANISESRRFAELGSNGINRLVNILTNDEYPIEGKSCFKEEFVTCGGISLENIELGTMESKECPNLYFAGEVLDIDAITGGFNLQAAWSTAYVVAVSLADKL